MRLTSMIVLFSLGLAASLPAFSQEHAPLLATCEADVALWFSEAEFTDYFDAQTAFFSDKTPNKTKLSLLPIAEVIARHEEMGKCWTMTRRVSTISRISLTWAFLRTVNMIS